MIKKKIFSIFTVAVLVASLGANPCESCLNKFEPQTANAASTGDNLEYRYRIKTTKTSKVKLSEPWILKDEKTGYTDWGNWSDWSTNSVSSTSLKQVETEVRQGDPKSYVMVSYRTRGNPETIDPDCFRVTASALNVRSEPNTSSASLGQAPKGNIFIVDAYDGNWVHTPSVHTSNGVVSGWLSKSYLTPSGIYNVQYRNFSVNGKYDEYDLSASWGEHVEGSPWTVDPGVINSARQVPPGQFATGLKCVDNYNVDGYNMTNQTGYILHDDYADFIWFIDNIYYNDVTWYRYRERSVETTYEYYMLSEWSSWSSTPIKSSDTIEVETRKKTEETTVATSNTNKVTTSTTKTITNNGKDNTIDFSKDIWNFTNTQKYFGAGTPYISDEYWNRLLSQLKPTEITNVRNLKLSPKFTGVCYGMSSLASLYKQGIFKPELIFNGAKNLKSVEYPNDNDVESLIVYYYLLQRTDYVNLQTKKYSMSSNNAVMKQLVDKASNVSIGEYPFVVNYGYVTQKEGQSWAHSVVAYGIEDGEWTFKGYKYNSRILIYDCAKGAFSDDACIYYDKDTYDWYIPYQFLRYDSNSKNNYAKILLVANSQSVLNHYSGLPNENSGNVIVGSDSESNTFYPEISINSDDISIRKTNKDDIFAVNSASMDKDEIFPYISAVTGNDASDISYFMTDDDSGYSAMSSSDDQMSINMRYKDESASVKADNAHKVTFLPDCSISIDGESTKYTLDIVTNDNLSVLPWYELKIDGYTNSSVSISQYKAGYLLSGDISDNLKVQVNNTYSGQVSLTSNLDKYSKVYITNENGTLDVRVDKDSDGDYETSVLTYILGDVNADGKVNIIDLALEKQYMIDSEKTIANLKSLDYNKSGDITVSDMVALHKYILNKR